MNNTAALNPHKRMDKNSIPDILAVALGGGIYFAIKKLVDEYKFKKRDKQKSTERELTVEAFEEYIELERMFAELIEETQIQRVCFFVGSNSGSIPVFGSAYYAQCLMADSIKPNVKYNILKEYNKVLIDASYSEMLINIINDGVQRYVVSEMKDSLLKRVYIREEVKYSELYFVDNHDKKLFYISVASYDDITEFDNNTKSKIDLFLSTVKQMVIKTQKPK